MGRIVRKICGGYKNLEYGVNCELRNLYWLGVI